MASLYGSRTEGRSLAIGGDGEKSLMDRYFLTVGTDTPSCSAIWERVSPLALLLLIL